MKRAAPPLWQLLQAQQRLPMHMPGHKRNVHLAPYLAALGAQLDTTEIEGLDNLHAPQGILADSMGLAARVFGARHSAYLVNGSTCGILACLHAAARRGDHVLVARNCHQSVYHGLALLGLRPFFLVPDTLADWQICASITPQAVAQAIAQCPQAKLLVLTSPTYEGVISDVAGICAVAHTQGVQVLVDEAHGAHLGLHPAFGGGAVACGADMVVQSLHKTLPSLTQTAIAHVGDAALFDRVCQSLRIFETSSPSYLLLASLDGCVRLLDSQGPALLQAWADALKAFDAAASGLRTLRILGRTGPAPDGVFALDPGKILLRAGNGSLPGNDLAQRLRLEYGIETEYANNAHALAMTGLGDTQASLRQLAQALLVLDAQLEPMPHQPPPAAVPGTVVAMPMDQALQQPSRSIPLAQAAGAVCAELVIAYPPGVPLLLPGEQITLQWVYYLLQAHRQGMALRYSQTSQPGHMAVLL